jgi:tRNA (guanine6-N2)-methyltransferase
MRRNSSKEKSPPQKSRNPKVPVKKAQTKKSSAYIWTVSALDGTQDMVRNELIRRFGRDCSLVSHTRADEIHFIYSGAAERLLSLTTAQTLLLRKDFAVSRPRTLLSPEHTAALTELIQKAQSIKGAGAGASFRFDAAGSGSPTMRRIAEQIENRLGLPFDHKKGDCVIAFRPGRSGWEVLCRVGNRPLATRNWRKVNYRGSLNAAIAACMVELTRPKRGDRYLNIMCGSGTLLIERLLRQRTRTAVGIDISASAISACRENAEASGLANHLQLITGDARAIEFPDASFDAVTSDLPYGDLHGSRASNVSLYRDSLREAARLCRSGGIMVILTQDIPSLKAVLPEIQHSWNVIDEREIVQRGYHPLCMALQKRPESSR